MRSTTILWLFLLGFGFFIGCGQDKKTPPINTLPDFQRMPNRLGPWTGKDTPLSPEVIAALEADEVIDRIYRHADKGNIVSTHIAIISDWDAGIYHSPKNCYLAAGWTLTDNNVESIYTGEGKNIRAGLSKWEKGNNKVIVLFWYQLGDEILLTRSDLNQVRSKYSDCDQPPKLIKVQLQIDAELGKSSLLSLAAQIGRWINNPSYDPEKFVPF